MAEISVNGPACNMVGPATEADCGRRLHNAHDHEERFCGDAEVCLAYLIHLTYLVG